MSDMKTRAGDGTPDAADSEIAGRDAGIHSIAHAATQSVAGTVNAPMLAAALRYAEKGWPVFPAPPGKKKSYKSGEHSNGERWGATINPAEIRRDFRKWPKANIGLPTGPKSGFFVVEADTPEGHDVDGITSLRQLEAEHGTLPATLMAISPSGSIHYYFKYPVGREIINSTSKLAPGVDTRGERGMVIAPPSIKPRVGVYKWRNDHPIADAPPWLIDVAAVDAKDQVTSPGDPVSDDTAPKQSSSSDPEADPVLIAAALAVIPNDNLDWKEWNDLGLAIYRATNGTGFALFDQWSQKFSSYNAKDTIDRWHAISKSPPDKIGAGTIFMKADQASSHWRSDFEIEQVHAIAAQFRESNKVDASGHQEKQSPPTHAIPLSFYNDADTATNRPWILKGFMARGETSGLIAPPGKGKSAVATDICIHASSGSDWRGYRSKERCGVVYFAFERADLVRRRLAAHRNRTGEIDLPIAIASRVIDLMSPKCIVTIVDTIRAAEIKFGCGVGLIVLDTYGKGIAYGGGDEDKAKDQNKTLANLRQVQEIVSIHILLVGHTGKDESRGARGSNAQVADADVQLQIKGDIIKSVEIAKANDLPTGSVLTRFKLELANLGTDEDGDAITVAVVADVDLNDEGEGGEDLTSLTKTQSRAMELLIRCINDHGKPPPTSSEYPKGIRVVSLEEWHTMCERGHLSSAEDKSSRDRIFRRAKDDLQTMHQIACLDGLVWLVR